VPLINKDVIGRGRKVAALVAALAAAPVVLSAVAHADPDPGPDPDAPSVDPKAQCDSPEVGGVFTASTTPDQVTRAVCQYIVEGHFYYDNYENGTYTGTLVYRDGAKVPTERPQMPEVLTVPGNVPVPFLGQP
jgi:hypothetical protein